MTVCFTTHEASQLKQLERSTPKGCHFGLCIWQSYAMKHSMLPVTMHLASQMQIVGQ